MKVDGKMKVDGRFRSKTNSFLIVCGMVYQHGNDECPHSWMLAFA